MAAPWPSLPPPAAELTANVSRLADTMRDLYVTNLAAALTEHLTRANCNWDAPHSKWRGALQKLCYECEPADDGVAPTDSQCCLAYDVETVSYTHLTLPTILLV